MTYNVFSGTLNPTHFTSLHHKLAVRCQTQKLELETGYVYVVYDSSYNRRVF